MKILISGAGIGGLTAALALHAKGHDVRVADRSSMVGEVGAGLQLAANATRVLHALGLEEDLQRIAFAPAGMEMRDHCTGKLITGMLFGEKYVSRYGAPYYQIHRGDLHGLLLAVVRTRLGEGAVQAGRGVEDFQQNEAGVKVHFADGETETFDLLIGADGIHSKVRAALVGPDQPHFTGHVAWRGVIPAGRLKHIALKPVVTSWVAPHAHAVTYYLRRGEVFNFVGITENTQWQSESWTEPGSREDLISAFQGWHEDVQAIVREIDESFRWALNTRAPLPHWSEGRVTLLGDACHPMLPYMAQGAAMAIEDAYILADCLELLDDVPEALQHYQDLRLVRTARVQATAEENGALFHLANPAMRFVTHSAMKVAGAVVPDLVARRFDWIMGYDATTAVGG